MAGDDSISRGDSQSLVPEVVSNDILKTLNTESAAMALFPQVPMSTSQTRMPVLNTLPAAYFVNGDTGLKQTTKATWANKFLNVEEIAAIIPIPENVLNDTGYPIWDAVKPLIMGAISRVLDGAIFFGTNKPASWPTAIIPDAIARAHYQTYTHNAAAAGGIAGDLSDLFATVEADGYDVSGIISNVNSKGALRSARSTQGVQLQEVTTAEAYGIGIKYPMRGMWTTTTGDAKMLAGDFSQGILGVRQDFTYKLITEGVITDSEGNIIFNLPQQDMVALRVVARFAFQVANTINYDNQDGTTRYPWAVLRNA